jgi:hypothetical protein
VIENAEPQFLKETVCFILGLDPKFGATERHLYIKGLAPEAVSVGFYDVRYFAKRYYSE